LSASSQITSTNSHEVRGSLVVARRVSPDLCRRGLSDLEITGNQSLLDPPKCPGLFYQTPARDGNITRIRLPGGIINTRQISIICDLAQNFGDGNVYLTNRANLQIRGVQAISSTALTSLKQVGLAAAIPEIDHIRNIMASPTAGIDVEELIDTLPLVQELDNYICSHPELNRLSAKFSVGFDGGGRVPIYQQPNDIKFVALRNLDGAVYLRLLLGNTTDIAVQPEECLPVIVALIQVYLTQVNRNLVPKPRFLEVVRNLGTEKYLELVQAKLPFILKQVNIQLNERENYHDHLDIHQQKQQNLYYIGIAIPLGKISIYQLEKLEKLAEIYGSKTLRFTPWQNIVIPDIKTQDVLRVKSEIAKIGLQTSANSPQSGIVACTGNQGCRAGFTDTKTMATSLIEYLAAHISLDVPCKIHLTSCAKSCAYHGKSDITLLGTIIKKDGYIFEGYHVYVGDLDPNFGQEIYHDIPSTEIARLILKMLRIYQAKRQDLRETFGNFANRHEIGILQQLFDVHDLLPSTFEKVNC
jgi:ferredoxin-nitrite reductase